MTILNIRLTSNREPTKVFEGIKMEENVYNELITIIKRRLTPQAIKIRAGKAQLSIALNK